MPVRVAASRPATVEPTERMRSHPHWFAATPLVDARSHASDQDMLRITVGRPRRRSSAASPPRNHAATASPARPESSSNRARRGRQPQPTQDGHEFFQFYHFASFAEYMLAHKHAIVKVRNSMLLDHAALNGCGATTRVGDRPQLRECRGLPHGGGHRARSGQQHRDIGCGAHHRHRFRGFEARPRQAIRSHRRGRRISGRPGGGGAGGDRRRRPLSFRLISELESTLRRHEQRPSDSPARSGTTVAA